MSFYIKLNVEVMEIFKTKLIGEENKEQTDRGKRKLAP